MTRRNDALAQLLHLGRLHQPAKLFLSEQKTLQQRPVLNLKVRQHPELFHRTGRQVLRFVDHQQHPLPLAVRLAQKGLKLVEQFTLGAPFAR